MSTEHTLPAETFAHTVLVVMGQSGMSVTEFADTLDVEAEWLQAMLAGEIVELHVLVVARLCRRLGLLPEDIWNPAAAAEAFADTPGTAFLDDDD